MSDIPIGLCQCGCGEKTQIAKQTRTKLGHVKGQPIQFINGHANRGRCRENSSYWKGGHKTHYGGYPMTLNPSHPRSDPNGYVLAHILTAEKALGKPLPPGAVVHHENGSTNSGPLVICQDDNYHRLLHKRMRAYQACGHANWLKCWICKQYDDPQNMYVSPSGNRGRHRNCDAQYCKSRYYAKKGSTKLG